MIEVPGVDMATVAKAENRGKGLEKGAGQPLLEEDFDQVIARSDDPGANKNEQHIEAELDRKSTRLNSSHIPLSRMPSSA